VSAPRRHRTQLDSPVDPAVDRPLETWAEVTDRKPGTRTSAWRTRSRWVVHLGLLLSGAAALGTLQLLHVREAYHTVAGLVFVGLVVMHLAQRRVTIARMATHIVRARRLVERRIRLALSDLVLFFFTANVLVSGVVDWGRGTPTELPLLPAPFYRWHLTSSVALVIYVVVHLLRRKKRFWRSTIR
jgi:hypothetical protein